MTDSPALRWTKRDIGVVALPALTAFVLYLPALSLSFTSDDFFILDRVTRLGGLRDPLAYFRQLGFFEYYRPLAFLSHALDWTIWGQRATGFHLTNVVLHAIASLFVAVLGRRLFGRWVGFIGGLLFALHPASHEAVYWIAARFDLLATCFMLASLLSLGLDGVISYWVGVACFALAILSKESALSLPVIAAAADVFVKNRDWRTVVYRLVPLLAVVALYAVLRSQGVEADPTGVARRLPKLAMIVMMVGGLVLLAWLRAGKAAVPPVEARSLVSAIAIGVAIAAVAAALLYLPASSAWMREKLGFVAFAGFYLVSPIVLPQPWPYFLNEATNFYALFGLVVVAVSIAVALRAMPWLTRDGRVTFLVIFVAAALVPVSSLTGGGRYLYLASVAVSLLIALATLALERYRIVSVALALVFALSAIQLDYAARAWMWASAMTTNALAVMTSNLAPCGTRDVILLSAPVGIRGTYCNFLWEAFGLTSACAPKSFRTLLRVVQNDVTIVVSRPESSVIELRVRNYTGNILASSDLSTFEIWVEKGRTTTVATPLGRLDTRPDGDDEVFRLALDPAFAEARLYYYGDGRVTNVQ